MYKEKELFLGKLDNVSANDIIKQLNFSVTSLDERVEVVRDLINSTDFFIEYFDEKYNPNINTSSPLTENNNICRLLEIIATYLLNSREIVEEGRKNQTKYNFITNKNWFRNKMNREISIEGLCGDEQKKEHVEIIDFLKRDEKNYKKVIETIISKKDLNRQDELGDILRQYNKFLEDMENRLKNGRAEDKGKRYLITRTIGGLRDDMKYTKESYLGYFRLKMKNFKETTQYNTLDVIDFTNEEHIKMLLKFANEGLEPDNDMSVLIYDFNELVKQSKLTDREMEIVEYMQNGFNTVKIANYCKMSKQWVSKELNIIVGKIKRKALELEKLYGKY